MGGSFDRYLLGLIMLCSWVLLQPDCTIAQSQVQSLTEFNYDRIELNRKGIYLLSGWALTNIATGTVGDFHRSGSQRYLHQINAGWNIINLAIARGALYQFSHIDASSFSLSQSLAEAKSIENILLLLNIGLNVSYITGGGYLWKRGKRKSNNRLIGYGQSLGIQGGFLLLLILPFIFLIELKIKNYSHSLTRYLSGEPNYLLHYHYKIIVAIYV